MLNMVFSQLHLSIREKISRDSIHSFQDLLQKAREVEMLIHEHKEPKFKAIEAPEKSFARCSFCRKKNHTAESCFKTRK